MQCGTHDFVHHQRRRVSVRAHAARASRAFTLLALLVVLGVLTVLAAFLLPMMSRARSASQSVTCLSNLHQIATGFTLFAERNGNHLPDPSMTQVSWEASLKPYLKRGVFKCPADVEMYPSVGSSYDWRDTPNSDT